MAWVLIIPGLALASVNVYAAVKVYEKYKRNGKTVIGAIVAFWVLLPLILAIILILAGYTGKSDIIGHY